MASRWEGGQLSTIFPWLVCISCASVCEISDIRLGLAFDNFWGIYKSYQNFFLVYFCLEILPLVKQEFLLKKLIYIVDTSEKTYRPVDFFVFCFWCFLEEKMCAENPARIILYFCDIPSLNFIFTCFWLCLIYFPCFFVFPTANYRMNPFWAPQRASYYAGWVPHHLHLLLL